MNDKNAFVWELTIESQKIYRGDSKTLSTEDCVLKRMQKQHSKHNRLVLGSISVALSCPVYVPEQRLVIEPRLALA